MDRSLDKVKRSMAVAESTSNNNFLSGENSPQAEIENPSHEKMHSRDSDHINIKVVGRGGSDGADIVVHDGRGETAVVCVGESMDRSLDKVSAIQHVTNCVDTQNVRGDRRDVRGEVVDEPGPDNLLNSPNRYTEGGAGGQGGGGADGIMYSCVQNVHRAGDEKWETVQKWPIKSGKLSRDTGQVDQKQTAGAEYEGGMFQNFEQTLQSRILMWEGAIQGEILADVTTNDDQYRRPYSFDRK